MSIAEASRRFSSIDCIKVVVLFPTIASLQTVDVHTTVVPPKHLS